MSRRLPHLCLLTATFVLFGLPAAGAAVGPVTHIVVLDETATDVSGTATELLAPFGLRPERVYEHALRGFSVAAAPLVASRLSEHPAVSFVEADRAFSAAAVPTGVDRVDADQVQPLGSGTRVDVDVAVIDTGVDPDHPDLDVHHIADCTSGLLGLIGVSLGGSSGCDAGAGADDHGHGTHVAGTVGALDDGTGVVGVAPGARIWGIKVLGGPLGSGSTSDVIAGIDYATAHADEIEVINMSLGGSGTSRATNEAIANATDAGIVVVVAAGNDSADASGYTPANAPNAITVSAITDLDGRPGGLAPGSCSGTDDTFATYSNFGSVVDIAAPGSCVTSTRNGGGTTSMSGTSMASPHVAGAAAWFIATNDVEAASSRWTTTLSGLLASSVTQTSPCGFSGGRSGERLLDLDAC